MHICRYLKNLTGLEGKDIYLPSHCSVFPLFHKSPQFSLKIILYNQKRWIHRFYTFLSPYVILHDREIFLPTTLGQFCKIVYVHQPTNKKLKKLNLVNNSIATLNNLCELQTQKKSIKKNICTCFLSISLSIRISSSSCSNWNKYFFPLQTTI